MLQIFIYTYNELFNLFQNDDGHVKVVVLQRRGKQANEFCGQSISRYLDIYSSNYTSQNSVWIYVLDVDDCCAEFKDEE